jgi:hypothetical protein
MPDKNQPKDPAANIPAASPDTASVASSADMVIAGDNAEQEAATLEPVDAQASDNREERNNKLQEIDLSEIDAYLKTLVPGVLGMSENLVVLGDKFQSLIGEMNQRVKTVDVNINRYELLLVKKNKLIQMTLIGSMAAVFLTLTMMFVAGFNYTSQVNQMNALSISLARRLSEVNSGLVTFEQINQSISSLSNSTENLMVTTEMQSETLTRGLTDIQSLLAASATETDASLTQLQANVAQEMSGILQDTRSSSAGIVRAIEQVGAAQRGLQETTPTLRELVALREQISALIVLERNQYLETIAATQSAAAAEVADEPVEPEAPPLQFRRNTD